LEKLNLKEIDTVVIDPMSNSAYLGTDEDEKWDEDGRYHLLGDLQLAPPSAFKNCLKNMEKMLTFVGGQKSSLSSHSLDMSSRVAAKTLTMCRTACPANSPPSSPVPKSACLRRPQWVREP
jgi:hypothetical protein